MRMFQQADLKVDGSWASRGAPRAAPYSPLGSTPANQRQKVSIGRDAQGTTGDPHSEGLTRGIASSTSP